MRKNYQILMAKKSRETEEGWLPLWMHLRDTAGIMKKLVARWVPESVYTAAGLDYEQFLSAAVFAAATHDIGKSTAFFQNLITKSCPEKSEELQDRKFAIRGVYQKSKNISHAHAGQWILQSDTTRFQVHESLAMAVGAHHGRPIALGADDLLGCYPFYIYGTETDCNIKKLWKDVWQDLINLALELAGVKSVSELPVLSANGQVLLSGLLIAADWIASNTAYFPLISLDDYGDEGMYPDRVQKGWEKVDFPEGWHSGINSMDEEMFQERFGFPTNEVQRCMLEVANNTENPGIFILEAQMGSGKTEAALGAAEIFACRKQTGGIFFGLPTQAASNGLFGRLYTWAQSVSEETVNAIKLAHSAAELQEEYRQLLLKGQAEGNEDRDEDDMEQDGLEVHSWFQGSKRALLSEFVIGTVDQFLMASLRRKHFMLRHLGLAGKVVVIDECHSYDAYMSVYLERSIEWMAAYGVPVILLSATLSKERREALAVSYVKSYSKYYLGKRKPEVTYEWLAGKEDAGYPLLTWTEGETVRQKKIEQIIPGKTVKITYTDSISDMARRLDERIGEGGCACVIVNTVKCAQQIYDECRQKMKDVNIILYHAQYTMPDRIKKEKQLLKNMGKLSGNRERHRLLVIGTQVLEQSLDYDADIMVTQLCPMDLLLQRIGRLHRHEKRNGCKENYSRPVGLQEPECMILRDNGELYDSGTGKIYKDYLLLRTAQILPDVIKIPDDISFLVQKVYNMEDNLGMSGERYEKVTEGHRNLLQTKKENAKRYVLTKAVSRNGLKGMLDNDEKSSEKLAEASVRDGAGTVEVLLMKKDKDGKIRFATGDGEEDFGLLASQVPDSEEGQKIAMQRLRLPYVFGLGSKKKETIRELEDKNKKELSPWQLSPWLKGELILLLDQDNQGELNDYKLSYSLEKGLEYRSKEV